MINLYESVNKKFNTLNEAFSDVVHIYDSTDCKKIDKEHTRVVIHDNIDLLEFITTNKPYITHLRLEGIDYVPLYSFIYCHDLLQVDAPELTQVGSNAFYDCGNLKVFRAPQVSEIGQEAFSRCVNLTNLDLSQVTVIGNRAFRSTSKFNRIILPDRPVLTEGRIFEDSGIKYLRIYQTSDMCKHSTLDEMYKLEEITFTGKDPITIDLFYNTDYIPRTLKWVHIPQGVHVDSLFIDTIEKRNNGRINYY